MKDDERAATERTRLLLVHDAESPSRNLGAAASGGAPQIHAERSIDLSGLKADRFASRVPQTATTDGHRAAAYATTAEPVTRMPTTARDIAKILVDPEGVTSRTAATVPRRDLVVPVAERDTLPDAKPPPRSHDVTVPDGVALTRRERAVRVAVIVIAAMLVLLLSGVVRRISSRHETVAKANPSPPPSIPTATLTTTTTTTAIPADPVVPAPALITSAIRPQASVSATAALKPKQSTPAPPPKVPRPQPSASPDTTPQAAPEFLFPSTR